tara:strand:- start:893 stop:1312 length:420 start_codon:yes stop_codon:yes gene_type:complete
VLRYLLLVFFSFVLTISYSQSLEGDWTYHFDGRQGYIGGYRIKNNNNSPTGLLKLVLYATKYQYKGGEIEGYELIGEEFKPLPANYYYEKIWEDGYVDLPIYEGYFYISILLLEYEPGGYVIKDWVSFNEPKDLGYLFN